jgi:hypothetical protein
LGLLEVDVGRTEVAVDEVVHMDVVYCLCNLIEDLPNGIFWYFLAFVLVLGDEIC